MSGRATRRASSATVYDSAVAVLMPTTVSLGPRSKIKPKDGGVCGSGEALDGVRRGKGDGQSAKHSTQYTLGQMGLESRTQIVADQATEPASDTQRPIGRDVARRDEAEPR